MIDDMTMTDAVYTRTALGCAEAIRESLALPEAQRRVLLRVNGLSPLSALAAHLEDIRHHAQALEARGLLEQVVVRG